MLLLLFPTFQLSRNFIPASAVRPRDRICCIAGIFRRTPIDYRSFTALSRGNFAYRSRCLALMLGAEAFRRSFEAVPQIKTRESLNSSHDLGLYPMVLPRDACAREVA